MYQVWGTVDGEEDCVLGEGAGVLDAVADGRANAHRLIEKGYNVDLTTPARLWRVGDRKPIAGEWVLLDPPTHVQRFLHQSSHDGLDETMTSRGGRSDRVRDALEELVHKTRSKALNLRT